MTTPCSWDGTAFNEVPDSENQIHSDEMAQKYGFKGALVPGVTVSAYVIHPAICAWGEDWLARGHAQVSVVKPVYDGKPFHVEVKGASGNAYQAELSDSEGTLCARADVSIPEELPEPPKMRGDPYPPKEHHRPKASRKAMEELRARGLHACRAPWRQGTVMSTYLKDPEGMPEILQAQHGGIANPAFVLGITNWVLAANVHMNPWVHLETTSQNYAPIPLDSEITAEAAIADLFEKKGHQFVDLDVGIFLAESQACATSVRLRAIYRMRD